MPKKSTAARGGAQRNRPKLQKNIELVRPTTTSDEQALETDETDKLDKIEEVDRTDEANTDTEPTAVATSVDKTDKNDTADTVVALRAKNVSTGTTRKRSTTAPKVRETSARLTTSVVKKEEREDEEQDEVSEATSASSAAAPKSAATRLAARRQSNQKNQLRTPIALITAEHYSYVRKDLVFIAVLAAIMFASIIVLHFVPGIGS